MNEILQPWQLLLEFAFGYASHLTGRFLGALILVLPNCSFRAKIPAKSAVRQLWETATSSINSPLTRPTSIPTPIWMSHGTRRWLSKSWKTSNSVTSISAASVATRSGS